MYFARRMVVAVVLAAGTQVAAARDFVALTGLEAGSQGDSYVFAGAITPLGGANLGQGWQARLWLDRLQYDYKANDSNITARAPGVQLAAGFKASSAVDSWGAYAGISQRNTHLSPDQPAADNRGSQTGVVVLVEAGQTWHDGWRSDQNASYEFAANGYWLRFKGSREMDQLRHGVAWVISGGSDYHTDKLGYTLDGLPLTPDLRMNLGVGASKTRGLDTGVYLTAELVYVSLH